MPRSPNIKAGNSEQFSLRAAACVTDKLVVCSASWPRVATLAFQKIAHDFIFWQYEFNRLLLQSSIPKYFCTGSFLTMPRVRCRAGRCGLARAARRLTGVIMTLKCLYENFNRYGRRQNLARGRSEPCVARMSA